MSVLFLHWKTIEMWMFSVGIMCVWDWQVAVTSLSSQWASLLPGREPSHSHCCDSSISPAVLHQVGLYCYPYTCNNLMSKTHFPWTLQKSGPSEGCRFMPLHGEHGCWRDKVLLSFQRVHYRVAKNLFPFESAIKSLKTKNPALRFQWEALG